MVILEKYLKENRCYKQQRYITVKGLMLHSVGCSQPSSNVFYKLWNTNTSNVAVHGVIDDKQLIQCLPWNMRGWHGGGSSNNSYIGIEMTEPKSIKYISGGKFEILDLEDALKHVKNTYNNAVYIFARLCIDFNLNPLKHVISHREGYLKGIASNHGDPEHLWKGLKTSYTMDTFRSDVLKTMKKELVKIGQKESCYYLNNQIKIDGYKGKETNKQLIKCIQESINRDYKPTPLLEVDGYFGTKSKKASKNITVKYKDKSYLVSALEIIAYCKGLNPNGVEYAGHYGNGLRSVIGDKITVDEMIKLIK